MNNKLLIILLVLLTHFCTTLCAQSTHKENGWYNILGGQTDSIAETPIVTVKDFEALRLDSFTTDGRMQYLIIGSLVKDKQQQWGDATEKAIGKQIGFVYKDTLLTCPQVNMRIDKGNFQISHPHINLKTVYHSLLQEMAFYRADRMRERDNREMWKEANEFRASITDTTFLQTRGRMSDQAIDALVPNGWNKDYAFNQVVYLAALERVKRTLYEVDGQLVCPLKSEKEIYLSRDLYKYILLLIKDWNKWIKEGRCKLTKSENGCYDIIPVR